jgi:hypothetical protein
MPVSKRVAKAGRGSLSEHMAWCKERALEYLPHDPSQAVASMMSDLMKHPETGTDVYRMLGLAGMMEVQRGPEAVRRWIEGFN